MALLHDNSSYAKGLAEETRAVLDKAGVKVVFYDALTPGRARLHRHFDQAQGRRSGSGFFHGLLS